MALDRQNNTPVVILREANGERVLPIWIGPGEATSIAMRLADMEFERPLTHDLLCSVLKGLGGSLQKVIITKVENRTYYAELIVRRNGQVFSLDARPSDSIAVALRVDARIFVQDDLLEEATIEIADEEMTPEGVGDFLAETSPFETDEPATAEEGMGPQELNEYLKGMNPEDFGRFTP